jgi:LmbE family N-acetylglucosaminyl deacetylase
MRSHRVNLKRNEYKMTDLPIELDVLAIFSHPDDAELSVAGTLLRLKSMGYRTGVCDLTRGEMGTRGTPSMRAKEALDAAHILKLDMRVNLEQADGHVWLTEDSRMAVVRVIRAHRPRVILTTHWDDPHPDHAATCRIVREAARLATMTRYDAEAGQPPVKMPAIAHSLFSRLVVPSVIHC